MPYFDVSIPLKLKTLTYYFYENIDLTGFAVLVPLKGKIVEGVVIDKRKGKPEGVEQIKNIDAVLGEVYSKKFIDFLKWISFYYISEIGTVLKATFFKEIIKIVERKKLRKKTKKSAKDFKKILPFETISVNNETLKKIIEPVRSKKYKTFLIHCPNVFYEMSLMVEVAKHSSSFNGNLLFIVPEIKDVELLFEILKEVLDEKIVLLHSEMSKYSLLESIEKIIKDEAKIVVGTRFALFAPIKKLSLIMLSQESSWLYKAEESPRYNTRDCVVMRGFMEEFPVVLTDFMPSTTSYYNALKGKYELINNFNELKHPEIKILRQPYGSIFHPETLLYLKLYKNQGILVVSPRSGYSLLRCSECGEIFRCEKCGYSMIFHKKDKKIQCFRCNLVVDPFNECPYCAAVAIHPIGNAVERLTEVLMGIFPELEIKQIDLGFEDFQGIFVCQIGRVKKRYYPIFKTGVVVDFDFFLSIPDYRALENAFSKVLLLSQLIKEDGRLFIQTKIPESEIFKYINSYNFKDFYHYELKHRKETDFPPFVRTIKLTIQAKKTASSNIIDEIKEFLKTHIKGEVIGPIKNENIKESVFILRSKDKRRLTEDLVGSTEKIKNFKGISYKFEVDPLSLKI